MRFVYEYNMRKYVCWAILCRLNEYHNLLKLQKSRRDYLYARLSEVVVAKV